MLEIQDLSARAGGFRLEGVTLALAEGECHAVLGPSGSGKSTLLAAVLGTLPVTAGRVLLAGEDITRQPIERRRLGYVPQHLGLFPHLSVRDNLTYSARARRVPETEYQPLLDRLIEITGIGALLARRIGTLSGGERQRVALVRALAANPRLVLLDEPFTALNEGLRRELWWLVKDLQRERGLTVLMVTHDLTEAHFLASHITVLIDGRQEQSGDKHTVYRRPASLAVARFLGLKNLFPARRLTPDSVDCPALGGVLHFTHTPPSPPTPPPEGEGRLDPPLALRERGRERGPEGLRERETGQQSEAVWLAIRAEHVALRTPADPPRVGETRLAGRYEAVLDLGESALLRFRADTGAVLEVRCGSRVLRKYGLRPGDAGVVGLPAGDLFVIPAGPLAASGGREAHGI